MCAFVGSLNLLVDKLLILLSGMILDIIVWFVGEREKRKDQLLDLAKSRQDRSDSELNNLRQVQYKIISY
jgi:hypothetical protein